MPKSQANKDNYDVSLTSRIRGLVLGLALGDAVGSKASDVPKTGALEAGVATQLAAWTVEGTLRHFTRYGPLVPGLTDIGLYAYQRWAVLRGIKPSTQDNWWPFLSPEDSPEHAAIRGWLVDEPLMSLSRGNSPATEKALRTGSAVSSAGCQAMLRVLPVAATAHMLHGYWDVARDPNRQAKAEEWARGLALLTHDDGERQNTSVLAVRILAECLGTSDSLTTAIEQVVRDFEVPVKDSIAASVQAGLTAPCVPQTLEKLAADKTSWSALAGGIYVALSFPAEDTVAEAIEFAGWAPDGDSVAAVAGAILGSRYGYEALPAQWVGRLELGWVLDRLAVDLSAEVHERQGGKAWKDDGYAPTRTLDPWWDTKYPGA